MRTGQIELPTVRFEGGLPTFRIGDRAIPTTSYRISSGTGNDLVAVELSTVVVDMSGDAAITTFRVGLVQMRGDAPCEGVGPTLADALRDLAAQVEALPIG